MCNYFIMDECCMHISNRYQDEKKTLKKGLALVFRLSLVVLLWGSGERKGIKLPKSKTSSWVKYGWSLS